MIGWIWKKHERQGAREIRSRIYMKKLIQTKTRRDSALDI